MSTPNERHPDFQSEDRKLESRSRTNRYLYLKISHGSKQ